MISDALSPARNLSHLLWRSCVILVVVSFAKCHVRFKRLEGVCLVFSSNDDKRFQLGINEGIHDYFGIIALWFSFNEIVLVLDAAFLYAKLLFLVGHEGGLSNLLCIVCQ